MLSPQSGQVTEVSAVALADKDVGNGDADGTHGCSPFRVCESAILPVIFSAECVSQPVHHLR